MKKPHTIKLRVDSLEWSYFQYLKNEKNISISEHIRQAIKLTQPYKKFHTLLNG
jgi:actin-like ATPase involved in cell morphogenesis